MALLAAVSVEEEEEEEHQAMWEEPVAVSQTPPGPRASGLSQECQKQLQKEPPDSFYGKRVAWGGPSALPLRGTCLAD